MVRWWVLGWWVWQFGGGLWVRTVSVPRCWSAGFVRCTPCKPGATLSLPGLCLKAQRSLDRCPGCGDREGLCRGGTQESQAPPLDRGPNDPEVKIMWWQEMRRGRRGLGRARRPGGVGEPRGPRGRCRGRRWERGGGT